MKCTIVKKRCSRCGVEYPLTYFQKNASHKDGHDSMCKACKAIDQADRYRRRKLGLMKPQGRKSKCDRNRVLDLVSQGLAATEVADIMGCDVSTVYKALCKAGKPKGKPKHDDDKPKKVREGLTCAAHCKKYPCFPGIETLSSNFAEQGCRGFVLKPKAS